VAVNVRVEWYGDSRGYSTFNKLWKKFKRASDDAGLSRQIRRYQQYEKPCDKRRREHHAAVMRAKEREAEGTVENHNHQM